MPRWTISARLTLWFGSIFFLGWLLFGAAMWFNLQSTLTGERYQTLSRRVDRLEDLLRTTQDENQADRQDDFHEFAHATGNGLAEVFRADGSLVYPPPSAVARAFPWPVVKNGDAQRFLRINFSGQSYWMLARPFSLGGQSLCLMAAAPEAGNLLVLHRFLIGLLISAPILLLVSSAGGYWVGRRALKPVDRIATTVQSISIGNLSERLPVAATGDELQRLTETCNAMLDRLEASVDRIHQFTADASHELRAPLSFTRTVAEVALRNPRIDPENRQAFQEIVGEVAKAGVLLGDMLTLARADANSSDMVWETVDLTDVIANVFEKVKPLADERRLDLSLSLDANRSVNVMGDFPSLRRLLWILLDNAFKYTSAPGHIEVVLNASNTETTVLVSDTGIGIAKSDLPHIFDRFYRTDASRSQVEGSGLGLAIAKGIAEMHRGSLFVISEENKGTTFRIVFPLCDSGAGRETAGVTQHVR
ncbi:MAG: ATP-binding protein [Candidatus Korobacteraceae bacterium]